MTDENKKKPGKNDISLREKISIVIPCYNEEAVVDMCHDEISRVIDKMDFDFEVIYVNDGSKDGTLEKLENIHTRDKRVIIINLSRNFGKEAAMTAGIDNVTGDAMIILDADLQDPPSLIPDMVAMWKETGADVIYGQRMLREGETWFKRFTAKGFYWVINVLVSKVEIPRNTGDFRLMNRRSIDALLQLREKHRFMKGLFAWIGYKQVAFKYNRAPRAAGETKWNYLGLWNLALEGIAAFSTTPLRLASLIGLIISIFSFSLGAYILLRTIIFGADIPGYASLAVMVSFFSGVQLLSIGILGEYVGRIFGEAKHRPLYFIEKIYAKK